MFTNELIKHYIMNNRSI